MDACRVEWFFAVGDSEEADALFIGFWSETFDFLELRFAGERTVFVSVGDDVFCQCEGETSNMLQKRITCSIQIYSDTIHDIFYLLVEFLREEFLVYVVLILSDSNSFWIDFGKFCKRVLDSVRDTDCSSHGHVEVRIFFGGEFGR